MPHSLRSVCLATLAVTSASMLSAQQLYEYVFTGKIASRQVNGGNADMTAIFNSELPNGLDFRVSFLVDPSAASAFTSTAYSTSYRGEGFISQGSVIIGDPLSPAYTASFNSAGTSHSLTVRNNEYIGTTGGGAPIYIDGINLELNGASVSGAPLAGVYALHSISIALSTPEDGRPAPDTLLNRDVPTFIDATGFQYRAFAFAIYFTQEDPYVLGYVGGGLGGTPGEYINPSIPGWGVVAVNSFTITPYSPDSGGPAVPEPSTYALIAGALALGGVMWPRRRIARN